MELSKKEMKFAMQADKGFGIMFGIGIFLIVTPILFILYLRMNPLQGPEKVFPQLSQMRNTIENEIRAYESKESEISSPREKQLIETSFNLKWQILKQAHLGISAMTVSSMRFLQVSGFLLVLWALDRKRMGKIFKKLIKEKEKES